MKATAKQTGVCRACGQRALFWARPLRWFPAGAATLHLLPGNAATASLLFCLHCHLVDWFALGLAGSARRQAFDERSGPCPDCHSPAAWQLPALNGLDGDHRSAAFSPAFPQACVRCNLVRFHGEADASAESGRPCEACTARRHSRLAPYEPTRDEPPSSLVLVHQLGRSVCHGCRLLSWEMPHHLARSVSAHDAFQPLVPHGPYR